MKFESKVLTKSRGKPTMSDEKYAADSKIERPLEKDVEKKLDATQLEPFGNEDTAEVKYRTMKWW